MKQLLLIALVLPTSLNCMETATKKHKSALNHEELTNLQQEGALSLAYRNLPYIPQALVRFVHLTRLDLSHNRLKQLPPELMSLTLLKELNLSGNPLLELPEEIGTLPNLQRAP